MGGMGEDRQYGGENVARLRERVAALQETLPLIRQNIADQMNQTRQHYDQRLTEQTAHFDRQLVGLNDKIASLNRQVSEIADEVAAVTLLLNSRPTSMNVEQRRVIVAAVVIAIILGVVLAFVIALWMRFQALEGLRNLTAFKDMV